MTVREIFLSICEQRNMSQTDMAKELGYERQANVAVPLSRNDGMGMRVMGSRKCGWRLKNVYLI